MLRKLGYGFVLTVLAFVLIAGSTAGARTPSGEHAQGMARNLTNLAGFVGQCIDKKLLDEEYGKHAQFAGYLGGFVLGSLFKDQSRVQPLANRMCRKA